jgi:hypothetical protein
MKYVIEFDEIKEGAADMIFSTLRTMYNKGFIKDPMVGPAMLAAATGGTPAKPQSTPRKHSLEHPEQIPASKKET